MKTLIRDTIIFVLLTSCVEEYHLTNKNPGGQLVVSGRITNLKGPHTVKVARTAYSNFFNDFPVTKAVVELYDDNGLVEKMSDHGAGIYATTDKVKGLPGRSYYLKIKTTDGELYKSAPDKMPEPVNISVIRIEYNEAKNTVNFLADREPGTTPYLRWEWDGTYISLAPLRRDTCWLVETINTDIVLAESLNVTNNEVVTSIPNTEGRFQLEYRLGISQLTLSYQAFEYLQQVDDQVRASSNLFQPVLGQIDGNLSAEVGEEPVLGFFSVAAVAQRVLYISPTNNPALIQKLSYRGEADCSKSNAMKTKPTYWHKP